VFEVIGFAGMCLVHLSTFPQLWKTWKTKKVRDISIPFWLCLWSGLLLYLIYAILIDNIVYIVSNVLGLSVNGFMLVLLIKYRRRIRNEK